MNLMCVGVDLARALFPAQGVDRSEKVVWRQKLTRANGLKVMLESVEPIA